MNEISELVQAVVQGNTNLVTMLLDKNHQLVHEKDDQGATALHYAAFNGQQSIVKLLLDRGAAMNSLDDQYGATPTGWAIEYLRENGGYLAIELDDLYYAIEQNDIRWITRFLQRFPSLREATAANGKSFRQLALESGNKEIIALFK